MPKHEIKKDELELINKYQTIGILTSDFSCYFCCKKVNLVGRKRNKAGDEVLPTFRCSNPDCQKWQSIYRNSFFSLFRSPMLLIVEIIKHWSKAVNDVLEKSPGKLLCEQCKANGVIKYVQNERGLIIHNGRVHNKKKKKN